MMEIITDQITIKEKEVKDKPEDTITTMEEIDLKEETTIEIMTDKEETSKDPAKIDMKEMSEMIETEMTETEMIETEIETRTKDHKEMSLQSILEIYLSLLIMNL